MGLSPSIPRRQSIITTRLRQRMFLKGKVVSQLFAKIIKIFQNDLHKTSPSHTIPCRPNVFLTC